MQSLESAYRVGELLFGGGTFAAAWVGILIRKSLLEIKVTQMQTKADLIVQQLSVKDDLDLKQSENRQRLAVHMAEDAIQFSGLHNAIARVEIKLDKLTDQISMRGMAAPRTPF